jgi:prolipoprotein diacylglyceryl transferase
MLASIPPPPFSGFELGPLNVRMYGLVIAVGALLAIMLVVRRYEERGGDPQVAEHSGLLALAGGFLGARIGYIIPRFLQDGAHGAAYIERPQDILAIWQGGLAFFGGLVGGAIAVLLYLRWRKADIPAFLDAIAPGLPLAQAIGRWGNYFNQELFGRPTDLPWALQVDPIPARTAERFPGATTFHPTFLYESLWNLGLVGVILLIDRKGWLRRRGSLFFIYLIGYGVGRGWIEALRVDTVERYFGLSRNNWVALLVVLVGVAGLVLWEKRGSGPLLADEADDPAEPADTPSKSNDDREGDPTTADHDATSDRTPDDDQPDGDEPSEPDERPVDAEERRDDAGS